MVPVVIHLDHGLNKETFLQAIVTGHSREECLQLATATGASCVAAYDALSGLKSFDELKEKIRNGWEKN